ncbi:MAG: molybdate ABC transporter substrate-binding protein [Acidobacteria bacterium]|nr:molybdate ABC transporter substrate-binding protein [Acidobacteriota bacterium]
MLFRRLLVGCVAAAGVVAGLAVPAGVVAQEPPALTVFAASDLGPAFQKIIPEFERKTRTKVTLVLGSTGTLAQQIRNGAPADVFFAANERFIDDLSPSGAIILQTRLRYAWGRIVAVTLKSVSRRVNSLKDLADPRVRRIAMANPAHAPYGLAAQQALEASGLWDALQPKLVYGENVQQAVQFVRSGSADAGIVARSIADESDLNWKLVDMKLHAPINQMAVVLTRTKQPVLAMSFLEWVNGPQGRWVTRQFGFLLPGEHF